MHTHRTRDDRVALGTLLREGKNQSEIAIHLGVHRSTISRELKRNAKEGGGHHATHADVLARNRRKDSKQAYRLLETSPHLAGTVEALLHPLISPEVIAHELGIHHQTIYAWVYRSRPDLKERLPYHGKKRRRYGSKREKKQGWTSTVRSIDERGNTEGPSWEGDTVKGSTKSQILTHVERPSLFAVVDLLPDGTADSVHTMLKCKPLPGTITYDRGSEFALWQMIEKDTPVTIYFAHPHHPWERGKNENTNGRLRRVFPKCFDFSTITQRDIDVVVDLMNHTPRKSLSWRTPAEVYQERCCDSG